jgi:hypothetical protein
MARRSALTFVVAALAAVLVCVIAAPGFSAPSGTGSTASAAVAALRRAGLTGPGHVVHFGAHGEVDVNVCSAAVAPGYARCDAHLRGDVIGTGARPHDAGANDFVGSDGAYDPSYLQSAYNVPSATAGTGQTVAVVDAYNAPNAESDLAHYRSMYGLPACTTANGCFRKVNQSGGTTYPADDSGWALEISLDLDMVSALCPNCHILLVEANDSYMSNLGAAVNRAVALGANVVSNSYGGDESASDTTLDASYFHHPGVAIVASTGDSGYGVSYPASSPNVVAVGGTTLFQATNTGSRDATETAWSGAGSGCSAYEPKPAWQTDTDCSMRSVADVSAVADPNTGVWVYDLEQGGKVIVGGTSASAPIVGAIYALAQNAPSSDQLAAYPYANVAHLTDVVSGSNGVCGGSYLCTGAVGYDGPTGLGTPDTAAAFTPDGTPPPPPAPDFVVAASAPTSPMRPGNVVTRPVTLTPQNGYTGTVHLSATVSPSTGLSKAFAPSNVPFGPTIGSSNLTFTAYKGGKYTVTITATDGVLVHTKVLHVTVNDFALTATPATITVTRGTVARYSVTITPKGAFNRTVTLSVSGLQPHEKVAYSRNPAPASGTVTVTITTTKLDSAGSHTLHITGTASPFVHTAAVVLVLK